MYHWRLVLDEFIRTDRLGHDQKMYRYFLYIHNNSMVIDDNVKTESLKGDTFVAKNSTYQILGRRNEELKQVKHLPVGQMGLSFSHWLH